MTSQPAYSSSRTIQFCGPRYGAAIEHLGTVWRRFLGSDALFSIVAEEKGSGIATRLIGSYIASFVSDDFASELANPPLKWIGPELVNRCIHGPVPILTDAEVRQANSTSGVNILVWPTAPRADFENLPELVQEGPGYLLRHVPWFQHQATSGAGDPIRWKSRWR